MQLPSVPEEPIPAYIPDGQPKQLEAPTLMDKVPSGHSAQSAELEDPVEERYLPARQLVQLNAPTEAEYMPAGHWLQLAEPASAEYLPCEH